MQLQSVNENTLLISLGDEIGDAVAQRVRQLLDAIRCELAECVIDLVPSYSSILLSFDLRQIDRLGMLSRLQALMQRLEHAEDRPLEARELVLPVYYGEEVALDMAAICQHLGLSTDEVIALHSGVSYRVYAIGFSPGFAFLGNTDPRLCMPRKATPRLKVPRGSLGIADNQTAIYPSVTPGGWQLIGRTPRQMIDWNSRSLALMEVGDRVRFEPVSRQEYLSLGGQFDEL
ncbi:5-oxoprolinase subunit PxpB [Marinobacterium sedimentorum]|uniref:5-oxoprolinase subunit PxpB n=1 Tax=Marinobacterium sedimentorum TaxID=2927804 RepID=UPI0020C64FA0|nr:5-oxoprolinase subunit PxpB [Marinobacterium sedimentorum]MCP8689114.1 5-oxoprolinase subunit PxpB [Marinobacterium sedimentorum]